MITTTSLLAHGIRVSRHTFLWSDIMPHSVLSAPCLTSNALSVLAEVLPVVEFVLEEGISDEDGVRFIMQVCVHGCFALLHPWI